MRCKKHQYERRGGGGGVCAPCLRERLLALAAAQNEAPSAEPAERFPRSVSPYLCRRKSDASGGCSSACRYDPSLLFFRTPQVGPASCGGAAFEECDIGFDRRRNGKFSVLATVFGYQHHRSEGKAVSKERKYRSWFAGIMPRRRRRKEEVPASSLSPPRRSCTVICNRGLSPERDANGNGEESCSLAESPWRPSPSPMRKPPYRRRHGGSGAGVSGFAVCLSPLVRPSPGQHHGGCQPPDDAFSGDLWPSPLHRLSTGASLPRCRSWKLADGGRFR